MSPTVLLIACILMLAVFFVLVSKKIWSLTVAAVAVPIVFALFLGYGPLEIPGLIESSVTSTMSTILMAIIAIPFFTTLNHTGMFDVIIYKVVNKTHGNLTVIYLATFATAIVAMLDGSFITTYFITIPAFLPVYKKLNLDRNILLILTGYAGAMLMPLPWCGTGLLINTAAGADPYDAFARAWPTMLLIFVFALASCFYFGKKNRGEITEDFSVAVENPYTADKPHYRLKYFWINVALLVGLIAVLCLVRSIPSWVTFLFFLIAALVINYPREEDSRAVFSEAAKPLMTYAMMAIPLTVMIGVMTNTGMLPALVNIVTSIIPAPLAKYTHIIFALIMVPVQRYIPYQMYLAMIPVMSGIVGAFGIAPACVAALYANTLSLAGLSSPLVANTLLGLSLAELDAKEFQRWATPKQLLLSALIIALGILIGTYGVGPFAW